MHVECTEGQVYRGTGVQRERVNRDRMYRGTVYRETSV